MLAKGEEKPIIGIDFGNTYSRVAFINNSKTDFVATIPSYVAFTDSEILIGDAAFQQRVTNPQRTLSGFRDLLGLSFEDVQHNLTSLSLGVLTSSVKNLDFRDRDGLPVIAVQVGRETKEYSPVEIVAIMLSRLKDIGRDRLGQEIEEVVVSVPSWFEDKQKEAVKEAGVLAGLVVIRTQSDAITPLMPYGLEELHEFPERRGPMVYNDTTGEMEWIGYEDQYYSRELLVLVVDIGGTSLNVNVVLLEYGVYEVQGNIHEVSFGGNDFTENLAKYLAEKYREEMGSLMDNDPITMAKLYSKAEDAKRTLSSETAAEISVGDFHTTISRSRFEELNNLLFKRVVDAVNGTVVKAHAEIEKTSSGYPNYTKTDIDYITLQGGSSHIPKIRAMLESFMGKPVYTNSTIPSEHTVALSAAALADIFMHGSTDGCDMHFFTISRVMIGIGTAHELVQPVILRGTALETIKSIELTTIKDGQTEAHIKMYAGVRSFARDAVHLHTLTIRNIPPARAGLPIIDVQVSMDEDENMRVNASLRGSPIPDYAISHFARVKLGITNEEVERMLDDEERNREEDRAEKEAVLAMGKMVLAEEDTGGHRDKSEKVANVVRYKVVPMHDEL
ncbi:heat shock protein 70 family [Massariosphaeria phaeospora]|uniref:Heat shock protein 70 family n=1 Tax=Massariosphaeria phaeospora TaxID=100035 RepID=A0A7C8I2Q4_9PLEO|nr:heat shock protein 70 family [Massariosphaeria phaeospora]